MSDSQDKSTDGYRADEAPKPMPEEDADSGGTYASPPCFMHELDASYLGYLSQTEVVALLNELLEGERAGAKGLREMGQQTTDPLAHATLRDVTRDEARFCAMLTEHIARLGGSPSTKTGMFYQKLHALETLEERVAMLNRGQRWVVRRLQEALPGISDGALYRDLKEMLEVHERNISRCTALAPAP